MSQKSSVSPSLKDAFLVKPHGRGQTDPQPF